jgi:hypothetical protein
VLVRVLDGLPQGDPFGYDQGRSPASTRPKRFAG